MAMNKNLGKLLSRRIAQVSKRFFCKRSIIIVSEHKTQHVPFAIGTQMAVSLAALMIVGSASYFSGSYMAAQKVLAEKDQKIALTSEENERVSAEFGLLKRDLVTLSQEDKNGKSGKLDSYAQMVAERYAKEGSAQAAATPVSDGKADVTLAAAAAGGSNMNARYSAVFQRIDYLENKVKELQATHQQMVADIKQTTAGKIAEIDRVLASTGVDKVGLIRQAELQRTQSSVAKNTVVLNGRVQWVAAVGRLSH